MRTSLALVIFSGCADITPIVDGETHGSVTVVQDWFTSVALVRTGAGPVLVDAGFRPSAIEEGLAAQDIDPAAVSTVLLTHAHGDHVAGREALPGAALWGIGSRHRCSPRTAMVLFRPRARGRSSISAGPGSR